MKLQINTSGAWRNVVDFDADRAHQVEDAAASLSRAAGGLKLRVLDDDDTARWLNDRGVFRALQSPFEISLLVESIEPTPGGARITFSVPPNNPGQTGTGRLVFEVTNMHWLSHFERQVGRVCHFETMYFKGVRP